MSATPDTGL